MEPKKRREYELLSEIIVYLADAIMSKKDKAYINDGLNQVRDYLTKIYESRICSEVDGTLQNVVMMIDGAMSSYDYTRIDIAQEMRHLGKRCEHILEHDK